MLASVRRAIMIAACVFLLCALVPRPSTAQSPVEISGFADVLFTTNHDAPDSPDFALGQVELDFDAPLSAYSFASLAVAYNPDAATFGLGAAAIDLHWAGTPENHPHASSLFNTSGLIIGQFDIPFGLDWLVYPSIDRHLISSPAAVSNTHGQWNDVGASLYGEANRFNAVAYLTNGFSHDGLDAAGSPASLTVHRAGGFRLGFLPFESSEFGLSAARLGGAEPNQYMTLLGADFQISQGAWDFKGEYLSHEIHYGPTHHPFNHGLYVQGVRAFENWYAVARYDRFDPSEVAVPTLESASFGAGLTVLDGSILRGEYQTSLSGPTTNSWVLQLASGF